MGQEVTRRQFEATFKAEAVRLVIEGGSHMRKWLGSWALKPSVSAIGRSRWRAMAPSNGLSPVRGMTQILLKIISPLTLFGSAAS